MAFVSHWRLKLLPPSTVLFKSSLTRTIRLHYVQAKRQCRGNIITILHHGETALVRETKQQDENVKKKRKRKVQWEQCWVTRITFQKIIFKDRWTFYLLWRIIWCLIVVKLLRTLSSSARLKSYPKGRETKRGELKLIEKIRIPLEKSNFIQSNFAEDVINNDHLQPHPTRKSQSMSIESFIF